MENTVPTDCTSFEPLRRCRDCGEPQPQSEFRKRSKSILRFWQCRKCSNLRMRAWRASKKAADRRQFLDDSLRRLRAQQTVAARIAIVDEIAAAFGNEPGAVGRTFHELLTEATKNDRNHTRLRLLRAYLDLAFCVAQQPICDEGSATDAPPDFSLHPRVTP
jgi:hypothetical protein